MLEFREFGHHHHHHQKIIPFMSTTNLILSLPTDVLGTVLHDWIGQHNVKIFATLDIAMCNRHCRVLYYSLLIGCPIAWRHRPQAKFQWFVGWLRLRGMRLTSLVMDNYPISLLNWKMLSDVKNLTLDLRNEHIDLNEILANLPQLHSFKLSGLGSMVFSVQAIPQVLKLKKVVMQLSSIQYSHLLSLLEALGSNAKDLTSMELQERENSYDHFHYILCHFPNLTELKYGNKNLETFPDIQERLYTILQNKNGELMTYPNLHTFWYDGDEQALLPVLSKMPNLIYFSCTFGELTQEFVHVLTDSLPALKILRFPFNFIDSATLSLLSNLPANTLEILEFDEITDECLRIIASRHNALKYFTTGGYIAPSQLGSLHFCQGTMIHLEELSFFSLDMPDQMYIALWASSASFPALRRLKLYLKHLNDHNIFMVFTSLLTSPLSTQLVELHFAGEVTLPITEGIDWKNVPKWDKLENLSLDGIPIFELDKFFRCVPNLRAFHFGDGFYCIWKQSIERGASAACGNAFQHANRLESFSCILANLLCPYGEYDLWKGIIVACPTLRALVIHDRKANSYWDLNNTMVGHVKLIQEYQHKITFLTA